MRPFNINVMFYDFLSLFEQYMYLIFLLVFPLFLACPNTYNLILLNYHCFRTVSHSLILETDVFINSINVKLWTET